MPYSVGCSPAPLTFTIRPRLGWQFFASIAWLGFFGYQALVTGWRNPRSVDPIGIVFSSCIAFVALLDLIRRERIEIYSERIVWSKTYFGITRSKTAPTADVLGAEWNEGEQRGRQGKGPDYVEFYLPDGSVKACFGFTFDDFDRMREDIRSMYPELITRWGRATVRSKDLTLLNLS